MKIDPLDPPYCRTCNRVLGVQNGVPGHTRRSKNDHPVDLCKRSDLPNPTIDCDFCHDGAGTWQYEFEAPVDRQNNIVGTVYDTGDYQRRHHAARVRRYETDGSTTTHWGDQWAACHTCAAYLEADDLYGLVSWVCARLPSKYTNAKRIAATRASIIQTYEAMLPTRRPGRIRL